MYYEFSMQSVLSWGHLREKTLSLLLFLRRLESQVLTVEFSIMGHVPFLENLERVGI